MDSPITLLDQLLSGTEKRVLIVTDWEPDDMIAIQMLLPELRKMHIIPDVVVSCWKDVGIKAQFAYRYLQGISDVPISVYMGLPTNKEYDISSMVSTPNDAEPNRSAYPKAFWDWSALDWTSYSLIIQLAPINELLELFSAGTTFGTTTLALYASFNVRSVMKTHPPETVSQLLHTFRRVIYYESFLATAPTIVEHAAGDAAIVVLERIATHPEITRYIRLWNTLISAEMKDSTSDVSKRIVKSIQNCPGQFVHADTGLIITLIMPLDQVASSLASGVLSYAPETNYSVFTNLERCAGGEKWLTDQRRIIIIHNTETQRELFAKHMEHMAKLF